MPRYSRTTFETLQEFAKLDPQTAEEFLRLDPDTQRQIIRLTRAPARNRRVSKTDREISRLAAWAYEKLFCFTSDFRVRKS